MAESRRAQGQNWGADLRIGDHLYTKDISETRATITSEGAEDEILPLLIEYQDTRQHDVGKDLMPVQMEVRKELNGGEMWGGRSTPPGGYKKGLSSS